jgi:hypothetical protein
VRRGRRQRETGVKAREGTRRGRRLNSLTFPFHVSGYEDLAKIGLKTSNLEFSVLSLGG